MRSALLAVALVLAVPAAAHAQPTLKLLSAGKGPRKPLRYGFQTGTSDRAVMTMAMSMKNTMPAGTFGSMDIVIPTVETDMTINMGEKKGEEHLFLFAIDDLRALDRSGVMPGVIEAMQGMLDKMKGMTGSGLISARGITRDSSFLIPAGIAPEVRAMLEQTEDSVDQMSAPLPVQAVGVGARWQTRLDSVRGDIKLSQTATYKVLAIRGDQVQVEVIITQHARPQTVTTATTSYELVSFKGSGKGTILIDLRHPVPQSKVAMTIDQVTLLDLGGGSKQKMPSKVTVELTMGRKN
jgi:hypothetical protein